MDGTVTNPDGPSGNSARHAFTAVEVPNEKQLTMSSSANGAQAVEGLQELDRAPVLPIKRLRLLWEQRRVLFRGSLAGLVVAALVAFLIPKRYSTKAQLMPPDPQSASSSLMMLAGMTEKAGSGLGAMAGDLLGLKSSGALFVGMLQSQTIQDDLVERFGLKKVYRKKFLEDARKELSQNTSVSEDRKSGIVTIAVTDKSPERAAALANAYVNELNSMVSQLSTSSAHRERVFLEGRLESVKQDLDDAQTQLAQFSSKNNTLDIEQQGKAMLDAAGTLAGEMIAAQSELQGLRQIYTDNNARVRALNARVVELRKQLNKLSGSDSNPDVGTGKGADPPGDPPSRAVAYSSAEMPYPSIRKLPLLGAKYADYYRRAKIQETVFELLTEQNELAKVEEAKETPSVKVLDVAEVPEKKSFPPRLLIICLGTAFALVLSGAWIIGRTSWQEIDPADERKLFVQEILATAKTQVPRNPQNGFGRSSNEAKDSGPASLFGEGETS